MIREYAPADREALMALHARSGDGFLFPDPEHPSAFSTLVEEHEGKLVGCIAGQWCVETFLLLAHDRRPLEIARSFKALADAGLARARSEGLLQLHVHTPDAQYARRLARLPGAVLTGDAHVYFHLERSA